jgi:hypothetical protein
MGTIAIKLQTGREISFEVAQGASGAPCFLLSIRKSGSSIANNICKAIAESNGRCFVEVGDVFFWNNVRTRDWQKDQVLRDIIRPGVIYGGFRDAPVGLFTDPDFIRAPKILLVRDLRDALISEYFSVAFSHPVPEKTGEHAWSADVMLAQRQKALQQDLASYVLRAAGALHTTALHYLPVMDMPNLRLVRYEDVILNKPALIQHYAEHFNLRVTEAQVPAILEWADVIPREEDPRAFIRRVVPGDHLAKLSAETIGQLNQIMRESLTRFGYFA